MRNDRDRSMYPRYETGCEKIGEKCTATTKRHGIPLFRTKAKPLDGCTHRNRANFHHAVCTRGSVSWTWHAVMEQRGGKRANRAPFRCPARQQ